MFSFRKTNWDSLQNIMTKEEIIIRTQTYLRDHAEIHWNRYMKEVDKGNKKDRKDLDKYHELHDLAKELDTLRS